MERTSPADVADDAGILQPAPRGLLTGRVGRVEDGPSFDVPPGVQRHGALSRLRSM